MNQQRELLPHLFRNEYRKIVSVLCKHFGISCIELAEDIASDTFLTAAETWGLKGIPSNPEAWLYYVAKNKAKNYLKRGAIFDEKVAPEIIANFNEHCVEEIDLSEHNIEDSQLRMMFTVCHPSISAEAQVGLALRLLCGFGITEIADAFLSEKETINKRLQRAKQKLREEHIEMSIPPSRALSLRLEHVLATIYLMFNEGYYSCSSNNMLRKDVCLEAMRLALMLTKYQPTNTPHTNALMALLCFHASRFDARFDAHGDLVLHEDQDTTLWNDELIAHGNLFLNAAATGEPNRYHIEAAIAYWHTLKSPNPTEKWSSVLVLYNKLYDIQPSPVVALNRAYAIWKVQGPMDAIEAVMRIDKFQNQFYYTLLGELYLTIDKQEAANYYQEALSFAKTDAERALIEKKMARIDK